MDYVYHNMSAFVSPGFPAVSNQAQELYGKTPDFEGHALDSLVPLGYVAPTDHYISNSMDTVPVPYARPPSNASPSSDHHDIDGPSMGPPTKTRKKKAPTLRPADWEPYKARIIELHITQDPPLSLKEVKDTMEREFGFVAELRQYRTRISQWGLDKNIKPQEMKAIVRKRQTRKLVETDKKPLHFEIRGNSVEPKKVDGWMKRENVQESILYHPSPAADTPSAICCWTEDSASSPAGSIRTRDFSVGGDGSIPQTPQPFSPTPSISSVLQPVSSSFAGQSPAPIYQTNPIGYMDLGSVEHRYREADEAQLREMLSENETLYGTEHPNYRHLLRALGELMLEQGRYKSAEEISQRLVRTAQNVDGNDSNDMLAALELLGNSLSFEGLYSQSEKLFRRICASRRKTQGWEHPETLRSENRLAWIYQMQGRYTEAEELALRVLKMSERALEDEHPDILIIRAHLATIYLTQGRYTEAEELALPVIETRKRVLGDEHPVTLTSRANLALIYRDQRRYIEAEELSLQVIETSKRVLGDEHPDTLVMKARLASIYRGQGRHIAAEELALQVIETRKRVLGDEHPTSQCIRAI